MSANEFLTRVNLMQARLDDYETPLPRVAGKQVIVIGAGNTAMDSARTAKRLGGIVTIVYRRTRAEMPVRVEELHHALEEGIQLKVLRAPREFSGNKTTRSATPSSTSWSWAARRVGPALAGRRPARPRRCRSISSSWRSAMRRTRSSRTPSRASRPRNGARSSVERRLAADLARGRLLGRRRHARRLDGHQRGRRRQGGGERDRRRNSVHPGGDQGAGRHGRATTPNKAAAPATILKKIELAPASSSSR